MAELPLGADEIRALKRVTLTPAELRGLLATREAAGVSLDVLIEARLASGALSKGSRRTPTPDLTPSPEHFERRPVPTTADLDASIFSALERGDTTLPELHALGITYPSKDNQQ